MSRSIWLIRYDIALENEATYLAWFHNVHMPEKLARPGYTWAAHYEVVDGGGTPISLAETEAEVRGFVALFGGEDTRTFLDPSPAQIKPTQPPLTREMMAMRLNSGSLIATEEWRLENAEGNIPGYEYLAMMLCDVGNNDEDYGAWSIQTLGPHLQASPGFEVVTKMLSTTNATKHVTIASMRSIEDLRAVAADTLSDDWSSRVMGYQAHATGSTILGRRVA